MCEITLRLQYAPHNLLRVVYGADRVVYLPICHQEPDALEICRGGQPIWSNEAASLFVTPYRDHIEVRLVVRFPDEQGEGAARAA